MTNNFKNFILGTQVKGKIKAGEIRQNLVQKLDKTIKSKSGEGYIDTVVKILIAVVIGALIMAGLYTIIKVTVMPNLDQKIKDLFDFKG